MSSFPIVDRVIHVIVLPVRTKRMKENEIWAGTLFGDKIPNRSKTILFAKKIKGNVFFLASKAIRIAAEVVSTCSMIGHIVEPVTKGVMRGLFVPMDVVKLLVIKV